MNYEMFDIHCTMHSTLTVGYWEAKC